MHNKIHNKIYKKINNKYDTYLFFFVYKMSNIDNKNNYTFWFNYSYANNWKWYRNTKFNTGDNNYVVKMDTMSKKCCILSETKLELIDKNKASGGILNINDKIIESMLNVDKYYNEIYDKYSNTTNINLSYEVIDFMWIGPIFNLKNDEYNFHIIINNYLNYYLSNHSNMKSNRLTYIKIILDTLALDELDPDFLIKSIFET